MVETNRKTLRELDDISCVNVVTSRNILRLIKKNPDINHISLDCYANSKHYVKFEFLEGKFFWYTSDGDFVVRECDSDGSVEPIDKEAMNKLIVYSYRALCDNLNVDLIDTPEDILAYAEQKLKEIIESEDDSLID